jgi:predicted nucleic acid-binding protein
MVTRMFINFFILYIFMKAKAILDTSFWIHLNKTKIWNVFLEYYDVVVPKQVEKEITYCNTFKSLIYKPQDIEIYEKLRKNKKIIIINPKKISKKLSCQISKNSGELFAIALAKEKDWIVFIDNGRPNKYCIENNIKTATIIDFLIFLKNEKRITKKEIKEKINKIKTSIPKKMLEEIKKYLKKDNL